MKVCVIGSGIAGLCVAFHLTRLDGVEVTIVERAARPGGRADVTAAGEHCPRIFLDDYHHLFDVLRQIPRVGGEGTLHDALARVTRYCYSASTGWIPISHLYRFRSPEIPVRERLRLARSMVHSPLVADIHEPRTDRYGSLRNYRPSSIVRVAANVLRSRDGYAIDGATDDLLIHPWLAHLRERGAHFRPSTTAQSISRHSEGVLVRLDDGWEEYDATVVAAYLPDLPGLLPVSPLARARAALPHTHCTCLTVDLDPREPVLAPGRVALYCRDGLSVLVQPGAARAVVLCVRPSSTDPAWVTGRLVEMLDLQHNPIRVRVRPNSSAAESVFTAEHLRAEETLEGAGPHVHLAGSYLRSRYPLDSAECAAQTAYAAVRRMRAQYGLHPSPPARLVDKADYRRD